MAKDYQLKTTMIELNDESPMPIGKHRGKMMSDVPASYFHWLWHNGMRDQTLTHPVANYIGRNQEALMMETPDLIWE